MVTLVRRSIDTLRAHTLQLLPGASSEQDFARSTQLSKLWEMVLSGYFRAVTPPLLQGSVRECVFGQSSRESSGCTATLGTPKTVLPRLFEM